MGGRASLRGYLIQTIIAVLDSLENDDWQSVCIEPEEEHEKVDIKWTFEDGSKSVYQVKSSQNPISLPAAKGWCSDLFQSTQDAKEYTLFLVGHLADNLYSQKQINGVEIKNKELNIESLNAEALILIEKFYSKRGKDKISIEIKDLLINNLLLEFEKSSIVGKELKKEDFDSQLLKWISDIERMSLKNPFAQFASNQQLTPDDSKKEIIRNILKLIGWDKLIETKSVCEIDEETGEELIYSVDFYQKWESKLKDDEDDHILTSSIIDNQYPADPKSQLKEYFINANKVTESLKNGIFSSSKIQKYFNILFWLSMDNQELNTDYNYIAKNFFKSNELESDSTFILVDNARINFLISSIVTAKNYNDQPVKFLYPITEENSSPQKIGKRGRRLPAQYINSPIIPIIKESAEKISILLFCNDEYSSDNLKKIIWLIVRLTSGFGNEYVIYFPDYRNEFENEANEVISSFNDELLLQKTQIKSLSIIDYSEIGNIPSLENLTLYEAEYDENRESLQVHVNETFLNHLPYGDIIKPFLNTELVTSNDLKMFLGHRGIFFKNADRKKIINLMTSLVYTPSELKNLVRFIDKKERSAPVVPFIIKTNDEISVSDVFKTCKPNFSNVNENINSRLLDPVAFKPSKDNPNIYEYRSYVEVKDPTKQIAVNTQAFPIRITCEKIADNMIIANMESNCRDGKTIGKRIVKALEEEMIQKNISQNESIKIWFSSLKDNVDRVNFLLSFTKIDDSELFIEQDIKSIKYIFDESKEIPEAYKDKSDKDIVFILRGNKLSGISEMSEQVFKNSILLDEIDINYKYNYRGILGYYSVKYNFSNAIKNKNQKDGEFRTEPFLHQTYSIKKNMKDTKNLENELKNEIEKMKINRFKQFNLI